MAQVPMMPYLTKALGADTIEYGKLQTVFSALQCLGGLLAGPLLDRYGGKAMLVVSFLSSIACYSLTATATTLTGLYASRLPSVLQHAVLAARTIVTDSSSDEDRATVLGYVGMAMSVGFAVGPALGGLLQTPQATAWFGAGVSVFSVLSIVIFLPALHKATKPVAGATGKAAANSDAMDNVFLRFWKVVSLPSIRPLLVAKVFTGLAQAIFQVMFTLTLQQQYKLDSKINGFVLSYLGVIIGLVQAFLVRIVVKMNGEGRSAYLSLWAMMAGFLGLAMSESIGQLCFMLLPLTAGSLIFSTVNTSQLTKAVTPSQTGTVLAIDMSLFSGVRMLAPSMGAALLTRFGPNSIPLACMFLLILLVTVSKIGLLKFDDWDSKSASFQKQVAEMEAEEAALELQKKDT
ncbi:MAG: hypothetical protein WDW36_002944 [Sanguina aurantia]